MNGLLRGGFIGTIIALALNVAIFFATVASGIPLGLVGDARFETVPLFAVILLTVVGGVGAIVAMFILSKISSRPVDLFLAIAIVVGVLSFIPTYLSTETRGAFVGLGLMHVAAALGIVWGILYGLRGSNDPA